MKIKHLRQPRGSRICGQVCVAMLAGVSIERAIEVIGHSHGTRTKEVIKALRSLGVTCLAERLQLRNKEGFPETALVKVPHMIGNGSHWVVLHQGFVFDPERSAPVHEFYLDFPYFWATSFLPIDLGVKS